MLGGEYQKDSQVNVGPLVKKVISEFRVDKLFVGIDGFDCARGFTGSDITRADTANAMMQSANQTIVLTDSTKFEQMGVISEFNFADISHVYTDAGIDEATIHFLNEQDIQVATV